MHKRLNFVLFALLLILSFQFPATAMPLSRPQIRDVALDYRFQDVHNGYLKRGRALLAADFDLDGRVDFFFGNPGDESYVMRNANGGPGRPHFEIVQVLMIGDIAWGGHPAGL